MACLHDNVTFHRHEWTETHGLDCGPYERCSEETVKCADCGEEFTPKEFEREMASISAEAEQAELEAAGDAKYHRHVEDQSDRN